MSTRLKSRFNDRDVSSAAADIAGKNVANSFFACVRLGCQKRVNRRQHAGRTEATLEAMVLFECRLEGRQSFLLGQAFDRRDRDVLRLDGEHQTGSHRFAVNQHSAGAADSMLASHMGASQATGISQAVSEGLARWRL